MNRWAWQLSICKQCWTFRTLIKLFSCSNQMIGMKFKLLMLIKQGNRLKLVNSSKRIWLTLLGFEHLWGNKMMYLYQIILSLCFYHHFSHYVLILIRLEANKFRKIRFSQIGSQLNQWEISKFIMIKFFFNHIRSILNQFVFKRNFLYGNLS